MTEVSVETSFVNLRVLSFSLKFLRVMNQGKIILELAAHPVTMKLAVLLCRTGVN